MLHYCYNAITRGSKSITTVQTSSKSSPLKGTARTVYDFLSRKLTSTICIEAPTATMSLTTGPETTSRHYDKGGAGEHGRQSPRGDLGVIAERIADFAAAEAEGSRKKINFIRLLRVRVNYST